MFLQETSICIIIPRICSFKKKVPTKECRTRSEWSSIQKKTFATWNEVGGIYMYNAWTFFPHQHMHTDTQAHTLTQLLQRTMKFSPQNQYQREMDHV